MSKQTIKAEKAAAAIGPYSQGIVAGGWVFTSGQIPIAVETGELVQGGIERQTHQVFVNLTEVLAAAGCGLEDVVRTTVFLSDMEDFAAFNRVYAGYFTEPFPARSCVQAAKLPRGAKIEIEAAAVLPE